MSAQKQDMQDMRQDIKQGQEPRAYWQAGQAGHPARVYRDIFTAKPITQTHSRARIGSFSCPVRPAYHINTRFYVLLLPLLHVLHVLLFNFGVKKA